MTNSAPQPRLDLFTLTPEFHQAMIALEGVAGANLDPVLAELVRIRASQINHCAWCLNMHILDARKAGESNQRIDLLSAWPETVGVYTDKERSALALTEAITVLTDGFVPDSVLDAAEAEFEAIELAELIGQIVAINSWNRISVATRRAPAVHYSTTDSLIE